MSALVEELRAGKAVAPAARWVVWGWVSVSRMVALVVFVALCLWQTLRGVASGIAWTDVAFTLVWLIAAGLMGWGALQLRRLKRIRLQISKEGMSYRDTRGNEQLVEWSTVLQLQQERRPFRAAALRVEYGPEEASQVLTLPWIEYWDEKLLAEVIDTIRDLAGLKIETRSAWLRWSNTVSYTKSNAMAG